MAEVTAALVKELRERTNVGMMDCKKALTETNGDLEAAADLLRQKGMAKAASKGSRIATEGLVGAAVSADNKTAVLIEVNCETDFVARNDGFVSLVNGLAKQLVEKAPVAEGTGGDLAGEPSFEAGKTVDVLVNERIQTLGEKVDVRRFVRWTTDGVIASYIHLGGKIGVLVELSGGTPELAKDIAMHVAASQPQYAVREEVPADVVEKERAVLMGAEDLLSKPEAVREKMVAGRINKFYEQICLVEQPFVKDPAVTVGELTKKAGATLKRFVRYGLGEGMEKKVDNFAEEVASYMKG